MSDNFSVTRILKNSTLLYVRMLFTMFINLYTTRLTLSNLGIDDLGVYSVVGSIVSMFTLFSNGIGSAIERFITFETGRKNGRANEVFCVSLSVIFLLGILLFILLETVGLWMLDNKINIPEFSREAAFWVFQFSVITCLINLVSIPYNILVIAHEKINVFAAISVAQALLTCLIAWLISFFEYRLFFYALLMAVVSIGIRVFYQFYCRTHYEESIFHWKFDGLLMKQITEYTGITTISGALQLLSGQGIVLFINWAFGVALNGVYSIAMQVKNSTQSFAFNLQRAISPQITKTYANGEISSYKKLAYSGSKMEIFLFYLLLFPFLFRTEYIMRLWLGNDLPDYLVEFVRCTIFIGLIYAALEPLRIAVYATNRILRFMLIPEIFFLVALLLSYFFKFFINSPTCLIVCIVLMEVLTAILRVYLGTKVSVLNLKEICRTICLPALMVAWISGCFCGILDVIFSDNFIGFVLFLVINSIGLVCIIYFVGLSQSEKLVANRFCQSLFRKKRFK